MRLTSRAGSDRAVRGRRPSIPAEEDGGARAAEGLAQLTRGLASLLRAGLPLSRALDTCRFLATERLAVAFTDVRRIVERGDSLASALAEHPRFFSPIYTGMVRAGERSGDLAGALELLAQQLDREQSIRNKLISALIYPSILACAGLLSIAALLLFVLPRFAELLADSGASLPRSTEVVLVAATSLRSNHFAILCAAAIATVAGFGLRASAYGRMLWSRALPCTPVIGTMIRELSAARFVRLTGTLLAGGSPLLRALDDTIASVSDPFAREVAIEVRARVRAGGSLASAIREQPLFPRLVSQLVGAGEEAGQLSLFLVRAAELLEDRVDEARQRAVTLVEPLLIVVFGGVIGFVALSLLQAIYSLNTGSLR